MEGITSLKSYLLSVSDVGMGGFFYWIFGHALAYGNNPIYANPVNGFGGFLFDADERDHFAGVAYLHFFYQLGNSICISHFNGVPMFL